MNMRNVKLSEETRNLIDEAVARREITLIQPAAASGNEMSRATQSLVAQRRREFRKAQKETS